MVRPYNADEHKPVLQSWMVSHNRYFPDWNRLPAIGYIAYNASGCPVAAGFLRKVEGGMAQIDDYMTNPDANRTDRRVGIDEVTVKILSTAKECGIKDITGLSTVDSIVEISQNHGFILAPHKVIWCRITE